MLSSWHSSVSVANVDEISHEPGEILDGHWGKTHYFSAAVPDVV